MLEACCWGMLEPLDCIVLMGCGFKMPDEDFCRIFGVLVLDLPCFPENSLVSAFR